MGGGIATFKQIDVYGFSCTKTLMRAACCVLCLGCGTPMPAGSSIELNVDGQRVHVSLFEI